VEYRHTNGLALYLPWDKVCVIRWECYTEYPRSMAW